MSPERLEQRARNVLLHQLARAAKSAHQLREVMVKREIPEEVFEPIIQRFIEVGLIDDLAFAETLVAARRSIKKVSRSAIRRELAQKGVAAEIIERVLEPIDAEAEMQAATELAIKRLRQLGGLPPEVVRRRLVGFLSRKGYASGVVFASIKVAEAEALKLDS
ncbi:MAG: hypothetical protein RLZZ626_674 [Actinomycetota bacterium]|jgi:regulatory protein